MEKSEKQRTETEESGSRQKDTIFPAFQLLQSISFFPCVSLPPFLACSNVVGNTVVSSKLECRKSVLSFVIFLKLVRLQDLKILGTLETRG